MSLWSEEKIDYLIELAPEWLAGELTSEAVGQHFIKKVVAGELGRQADLHKIYSAKKVNEQYGLVQRTPKLADRWKRAEREAEALKGLGGLNGDAASTGEGAAKVAVAKKTSKQIGTARTTAKNTGVDARRRRRTQPYSPPRSKPQQMAGPSEVLSPQSRDGGEAEMNWLATEADELNIMETPRDVKQVHAKEPLEFGAIQELNTDVVRSKRAQITSSTGGKRLSDKTKHSSGASGAKHSLSAFQQPSPEERGRETQQYLPPIRQAEPVTSSIPAPFNPLPTPVLPHDHRLKMYPLLPPLPAARQVLPHPSFQQTMQHSHTPIQPSSGFMGPNQRIPVPSLLRDDHAVTLQPMQLQRQQQRDQIDELVVLEPSNVESDHKPVGQDSKFHSIMKHKR